MRVPDMAGDYAVWNYFQSIASPANAASDSAKYWAVGAPPEGGRLLIYAFAVPLDVPEDALVLGEGQGLGLFAPDALPGDTVPDLRRLLALFVASDTYAGMVGR